MSAEQAAVRYALMIKEWEALGHRRSPCSGHSHPLPGCPAPSVHAVVFPPENDLTLDKVLAALKAVFEDLDSTGRAGDEWAYAWVHEAWPNLVPLVVRKAVGDPNALEES